jgi:hypothetical protein
LSLFSRFGYVQMGVFNNKNLSPLRIIYMGTGLIHSWSSLRRIKNHDIFMKVSTRLEDTLRDIFNIDDNVICRVALHHRRGLYSLYDDGLC